ncbi:MAG TPA: TolC family protein [Myxococcota bacterium]|jgi:outer membrane protein TolC
MNATILLLALASQTPTATPPPPEGVLTLDAALTRAWNEAPAVSTAEANAQVARARIDIAAANGFPSLAADVAASGGAGNSNGLFGACSIETATGCSKGAGVVAGVTAGLGAQWLLFDFGRTSENVRSARLSANASDADVDSARYQAAVTAGASFLAVAGDEQLMQSRSKIVEERQRLLDVAHGRVQTGVAAPIEETRAKVALETAKVDVLTTDAARKNDLASLAIALGMDPNKQIAIAQPGPLAVNDDPVQAADLAEQARPELAALKLRVDAAEATLSSARAGRLPSLTATANANAGPSITAYGAPAGTLAEQATLGATFSIPIFDAGISAAVAAAEAEDLVAKAGLRQATLDLRAQAAQAATAVRSNAAALSAAEQLLSEADEDFRQASGRYELGAASLLELTDAENEQSSATLSVVQARFQLEAARLRLLAAIGTIGRSAPTGSTTPAR